MRRLFMLGVIAAFAACGGGADEPFGWCSEDDDVITSSESVVESADGLARYAACTTFEGDLTLDGLDDVDDLSALGKMSTVRGTLTIKDTRLVDLRGLDALQSVGAIALTANDELLSMDGLSALTNGGAITIERNPSLTTLRGPDVLTLASTIRIENNPVLNDLEALRDLEAVNFGFIGGTIALENNDALTSLDGLPAAPLYERAAFSLDLRDNDALVDLRGAERITRLSSLTLLRNGALVGLDGLENVTTVRIINVQENARLASLDGLSGLQEVTADDYVVQFVDNPLLPQCEVEAFAARFERTCACEGNDSDATCDG